MLKTEVFLDSNNLTNLSKIFSEGLLKSELVIAVGTAGLLTRPWRAPRPPELPARRPAAATLRDAPSLLAAVPCLRLPPHRRARVTPHPPGACSSSTTR